MRIDPVLRALRSDDAPQRKAQAALESVRNTWLESEPIRRVLAELERYGGGAPLADCPSLDTMVAEPAEAISQLRPLIEGMTGAMARHPIGQVPFRHQYNGGIAVIQLAERGRASLSIVTYEEAPQTRTPQAQSVCFADGERHECYLAGAAEARLLEVIEERPDSAVLDSEMRILCAGETLSLTGQRKTKLVQRIHGRLTMLRLGRTAETPGPSREYRLSDGALLHRASGDRGESRDEMMMALLGQMGRQDAVPAIAAITQDGSEHLRWQAVRECLALNSAAGFSALCALAADQEDCLSHPAGVLRAQLTEAHPQLAELEKSKCPA